MRPEELCDSETLDELGMRVGVPASVLWASPNNESLRRDCNDNPSQLQAGMTVFVPDAQPVRAVPGVNTVRQELTQSDYVDRAYQHAFGSRDRGALNDTERETRLQNVPKSSTERLSDNRYAQSWRWLVQRGARSTTGRTCCVRIGAGPG